MRLQHAAAAGDLGISVFGPEVAQILPRDTGEWLAVLNSASGTSTQDISLTQDALLDRISFADSHATIEQSLLDTVGPALCVLSDRSQAIFGITRACEYDSEDRECLIRAHILIASTSSPSVLYERYQQLIAAVADARNEAGVSNLDVDIRID